MTIICNGDDELLDGTPGKLSIHSIGCGRQIDIGDGEPWDVKTDADGNVLSRHRQVYCPDCGTATWIRKGYPQSEVT